MTAKETSEVLESITFYPGADSLSIRLRSGRSYVIPEGAICYCFGELMTRRQWIDCINNHATTVGISLEFDGVPEAGGIVTAVRATFAE